MANWTEIERAVSALLSDDYYRRYLTTSPRKRAMECVQEARGSKLSAFSGDIKVVELKHPARPGLPIRLVRGFDSTRTDTSMYGAWWIDYELFERFRRATSSMARSTREQKIRVFMRARSAVSYDFNNMAGISELNLPVGSRTPAIVGNTHYQPLVADTGSKEYVPNVLWIGGDRQFYVCIRDPNWIRNISAWSGVA
jgi:hypothetical protein